MPRKAAPKGKKRRAPKRKAPARQKKMSERVLAEIVKADPGVFVCPYCRKPLNWQSVGMAEAELSIYVREKIYFCPECRSFLGVSSWHPEG